MKYSGEKEFHKFPTKKDFPPDPPKYDSKSLMTIEHPNKSSSVLIHTERFSEPTPLEKTHPSKDNKYKNLHSPLINELLKHAGTPQISEQKISLPPIKQVDDQHVILKKVLEREEV